VLGLYVLTIKTESKEQLFKKIHHALQKRMIEKLRSNGSPFILSLMAIGLTGCGGAGNIVQSYSSGGTAVKGLLSNATVFIDLDSDGVLDNNELSTTTNAMGSFSFSTADQSKLQGDIIVKTNSNTVDSSSGELLPDLTLTAVEGSDVVTPATTLIKSLVDDGATEASAAAQVKSALGITSDVDLSTFNPFDPNVDLTAAKEVEAAAQKVVAVANTIAEAAAANGADKDTALVDAIDAIATLVTGSGTSTLNDATTIQAIVNTVDSTLDASVATAIQKVNDTIDVAVDEATTLEDARDVFSVAQTTLTEAAVASVSGDTSVATMLSNASTESIQQIATTNLTVIGNTKTKVFESDFAISQTGKLEVSDSDTSDEITYRIKEGSAKLLGSNNLLEGSLTVDTDGDWIYNLDVTNDATKSTILQSLQDPNYKNDLTNGTDITDFQIIERFEVQLQIVDGTLNPESPTISDATYDGTVLIKKVITIVIGGVNDTPVSSAEITNISARETGVDISGNAVQGNDAESIANALFVNLTDTDTARNFSVAQAKETTAGTLASVSGADAANGTSIIGLYGTIKIGTDGSYSYVVDNTNNTVQALDETQTLDDSFTVSVSDGAGGSVEQVLTVTINGTNDAPTSSGAVTNSDAREAGVDVSGAVAAVAATGVSDALFANLTDVDDVIAAFSVAQAKETTAGTLASVSGADAANGTSIIGLYGTIKIGTDGSYSYVVDNTNNTVQALDETQTLDDSFTVSVSDGAGGSVEQVLTVTINGTNDAPTSSGAVTNSDAREAGVDVSGAVAAVAATGVSDALFANLTDVDDVIAAFSVAQAKETTAGTLASVSGADAANGTSIIGLYGTIKIGTDGSYSYVVDNTNNTVQALDETQTLDDSFTVSVSDGAGGSVEQVLTVTINGTNDAPTSSGAVTNSDAREAGVDVSGAVAAVAATGVSDALFANLTDVDDVIAAFSVAQAKETTAGTLASVSGADAANGTSIIGLYGTIKIGTDGSYSYVVDNTNNTVQALDETQTLDDSFTVSVSDGAGGSVEQVLTVTINGTNDAPTSSGAVTNSDAREAGVDVSGAVAAVAATGVSDALFANLTDVDDVIAAFSVAQAKETTAGTLASVSGADAANGTSIIGLYGTIKIGTDGSYSYVVDNTNNTVQALDETQTLDDSFTVSVSDGAGGSVEQVLTVTINGTNDAPTLENSIVDQSVNEDSAFSFSVSSNTFKDIDNSDTLIYSATYTDGNSLTGTWLSFNSDTQIFSGIPTNSDVSDVNIRMIASDGITSVYDDFTIKVSNTNDTPLASNKAAGLLGDQSTLRIDNSFLNNSITDVDVGDTLTITNVSTSGGGAVAETATGSGVWVYTPPNVSTDTNIALSYTIEDTAGANASANITLTVVEGVHFGSINEDSASSTLSFTGYSIALTDGEATKGSFIDSVFTPIDNLYGDVDFTLTNNNDNSILPGFLTVLPVNDAPTTSAVTLTAIVEDSGALTITNAQLIASATDQESDTLTVSNVAISSGSGTLVDNNDGTWSYTPAANDDTSVSFSYKITDDGTTNGTSDPLYVSGTATLDITTVNDAPTTSAVTLTAIAEDSGALTITNAQLIASATDQESDTLTVSNVAISSGSGTLVDNNDGTWSYTPAANDDTSVSFSYKITDDGTTNGTSDPLYVSGTATLDITTVNDAPTTSAVTLTAIVEDSGALTITNAQLIASATDQESDTLTVSNVAISSGSGTLVDNNDGTWSYTPAANDDTSVSFSYKITDDGTTNGTSDPLYVSGTATLDITTVNDAPTTSAVTLTAIAEDSGALTITNAQLIASATDQESDTLTVSNVAISSGSGTLVDNNDGTWSYTPAANDDTSVSFSYKITDDGTTNGTSDPLYVSGTATLDITTVNDAPTTSAVTLTAIVEDSGALTITNAQLIASATDQESDTLTVSNVAISSGSGTLVDNNDGTWSYTPAANDDTSVSFSYKITDDGTTNGTSDPLYVSGTATLDITTVNDAPTTSAVTLTAIAEDSGALTITNAQLIASATDQESDTLTVSNVAISSGSGTLVDNNDGTWSYTPAANDDTSVSFSYKITDDGTTNGTSDPLYVSGTATLDITTVNDAPSGTNITKTTDEDVPFNFQSDHFAFIDSVDNNNFAGIVIASLPTSGTLALSGSLVSLGQSISSSDISNLVFTPATNAYGTNNSSFSFKVFDDGGTENGGQDTDQTAKIWTFNVNSVDDYAVVSGDTSGSASQFAGAITGDLNATDVEGLTDSDYFSVSTNATNGTASINSETGAWSYVPTNSGITGADSFIVTVTDDLGGTTTQTIDVTINAIQNAISATVRQLTAAELRAETRLDAPSDNYYALDLDIDISAYTSLVDDVGSIFLTLDSQSNPFEVIKDTRGDVYFAITSESNFVTPLIDNDQTQSSFGTGVFADLNGFAIVDGSNSSEDLGSIYFNLDDNLTTFEADLIDIAIVETNSSGGDDLILSPLNVDIF
jgi:VCBS repeat-containing protein